MSELAAKLARRRALNGEGEPSVNAISSSSNQIVQKPSSSSISTRAPKAPAPTVATNQNIKKYPTEPSSDLFDGLNSESSTSSGIVAKTQLLEPDNPRICISEAAELVSVVSNPNGEESLLKVENYDKIAPVEEQIVPKDVTVLEEVPPVVSVEKPRFQSKKSDLDEFEDFLETIDKDLVNDFGSPSLSVSRSNNEKFEHEAESVIPMTATELSLENKELRKELQSLRKIYHDKSQRFNQLQRELTSLRLSLQPQSKIPTRSASLFHAHHDENSDEFFSKFDEYQKSSGRQGRRNHGSMFDDHEESQSSRSFRKSENEDVLENNFYFPSETDGVEAKNFMEINIQLKEEIQSLKRSVAQKDHQIDSLESDIRTENERFRSRSLSSAESDGVGPSGIAALRSNIDHMGFDGASIFVSESAALSSEDQSNLDRLLLFPSSASTIQASSTSLLNDSQMGFVFLKHKAYNYDGESESSSTGVSQQQLLTGLFAKDSHVLDADGPPAVDGNNLFKEDKPARKAPSLPTNAKVISYQEFLDRLMHPKSGPISTAIRNFLMSVLGPNGDCSPPATDWKLDYEFHGMNRLASRCCDFMDAIIEHMTTAPLWRGESEEGYIAIRDHLEKYLLAKIGRYAFQSVECPEEDSFLLKRMSLLSFIQTKHLDIKAELCNDLIWTLARDELKKINSYETPVDKVACIMKCSSVIFRSLNLARAKTEDTVNSSDDSGALSAPGADDFLPLFIWVVLHCHVPKLVSNCEYIQSFHNPIHLRGKAGYCLVNLRSAMEFVLNLEHQDISHMTEEEFQSALNSSKEAFEQMNPSGGVGERGV